LSGTEDSQSGMVSLADVLHAQLDQRSDAIASLRHQWPQLVGSEAAAATWPHTLRDGTLVVGCRSGTWATELLHRHDELLLALQRQAAPTPLERVRTRIVLR
jgi:predicted nucleic acid-binding Zn ribbon protein